MFQIQKIADKKIKTETLANAGQESTVGFGFV
jgi:hypothetical protein